ncbi:MAG: RHS repeat-associated core domain-containing protein [Bacteroidales bacterium]|nr:RHS repeat-associated core domain-containing protein [Bacteroidales bacterium]
MSTGVSSKIYLGSSEFILDNSGNITSSRTFITAPTGICAVWEKVGSANGALHYIHTDNQGSWLKITSESGTVENTYSYDAWGRPRNPSTWVLKPISIANALGNLNDMQPRFDRGYTGHEHMAGFGLINMNGRLYDPYLQRFLSPDPFVKSPNNAQNYNRYTYCLNNPLAFTDPTGYNQKELMDNGFKLSDLGYDMRGGSGVIVEYLNRGRGPAAGSAGYVYNWDGTYTDKATGKTVDYKAVQTNWVENKCLTPEEAVSFLTTTLNIGTFAINAEGYYYQSAKGSYYGLHLYNGDELISIGVTSITSIGNNGQGGGSNAMDWVQGGLDVVGLIPVIGEVADGANALIYTARGDYLNAGLSAAAMIPIAGWAATGAKAVNKTIQLTAKARTAERGLELAGKFLKPGYSEIAPGVFRSSDQLRQFRMTTSDITGAHGPGPHFNFEIFSPLNLNKAATNYHVPIINP